LNALRRPEKIAIALWVALGIGVWNAMYDQILEKGIKEYLFRSTLHEAGRAPQVAIATVLQPFLFDAVWVSTFWAALVMLAGLLTIRMLRTR
jgi:uncharacterized membrane protein SpoIIM required for sporulation